MLQYTLHLVEPDTGQEWSQLVNCVIHAEGRSQQTWEKLQQSDPRLKSADSSSAFAPLRWVSEKLRRPEPRKEASDTSPAFAPFYYIPDLEMLVQVFPHDNRLPALPLLMAELPPELKPQLLAQFGPGDWKLESWDIKPVRYLPETRATLLSTARVRDVATDRAKEKRFYVKVYHNAKGEQTYQVLRELWETASTEDVGFTVGKPVAYLSDLRTLVQEETPGTSLEDILLQEGEATPAVRKAARALATLHLTHAGTPRHRRLRNEIAAVERRGRSLQQACPHLSTQIEEIVRAVVDGLEEVPPAPIHGNLKLDHILLDGERVGLIDLDSFAGADPILDTANVLAHFTSMPLRSPLSQERARAAAQAFVEEYFALVPEAWRRRLSLRYAYAVLKRSAGLSKQEPGRDPSKIDALIEEARASLTGRVW
jgi:hypothetical protein